MNLEVVQAFGVVAQVGGNEAPRRRFGVPPGGPFDREAATLANALLGLAENALVWELGMANVRFRSLANGMVAVVGAPASITVDGHGASSQSAFPVHAGAEIHVGPPDRGARVYVVFHSGLDGRIRRLSNPPAGNPATPIRVVTGPQANLFDFNDLADSTFTIGMSSDRVGIRLQGSFPSHDIELPSEPACVGTIQVTGSGELLILGPDGPTIAGYPKIAVVIDADLDRLAQLRPGALVGFQAVDMHTARAARIERLTRIKRVVAGLRTVTG